MEGHSSEGLPLTKQTVDNFAHAIVSMKLILEGVERLVASEKENTATNLGDVSSQLQILEQKLTGSLEQQQLISLRALELLEKLEHASTVQIQTSTAIAQSQMESDMMRRRYEMVVAAANISRPPNFPGDPMEWKQWKSHFMAWYCHREPKREFVLMWASHENRLPLTEEMTKNLEKKHPSAKVVSADLWRTLRDLMGDGAPEKRIIEQVPENGIIAWQRLVRHHPPTDSTGAVQLVKKVFDYKGESPYKLSTCLLYTSPSPRD